MTAFRLAGDVNGRERAFTLRPGDSTVGSAPDCDVQLDEPSVSRRHAVVIVSEGNVTLRDLGSRNGTYVAGRRVASVEKVALGEQLGFGGVTLRLEPAEEPDSQLAVVVHLAEKAPPSPHSTGALSTLGTRPADAFALDVIPALLRQLISGAQVGHQAATGGAALYNHLPTLAVEILRGEGMNAGILFQARREVTSDKSGEVAEASSGDVHVRCEFPDERMARLYGPLVETVAGLIYLAEQHPTPPRPARAPVAAPDPESVIPEVQQIYADAANVARSDIGVLINGESGTGKEVLARFIHASSPRAEQRFVALNCAALPKDLLEAELFGIERGVATGVDARPGKFELAHGGTLFLDEIGDMAPETQASILRVLQEQEVFRLGGTLARPAQVRILAATHRALPKMIAEGRFREDLYYRIATWLVELPPLRRRRADIPGLSSFFLSREAARNGIRVTGISRTALDALVSAPWPGNIRQLEKEMARAVLFLKQELVDSASLSPEARGPHRATKRPLQEILAETERSEIERALTAATGDVAQAAESLGLSRSTLYRRLKELGMNVPT